MPKDMKLQQAHKPSVFQIIEKRVEHSFTFKITDERVLLAISLWAESAGVAIIYLWYIQAWCFKNQIKEVDLQTLGFEIFPNGIFSEKDLKSVWENQKVQKIGMDSDNLIDYGIAGLSLQFIK